MGCQGKVSFLVVLLTSPKICTKIRILDSLYVSSSLLSLPHLFVIYITFMSLFSEILVGRGIFLFHLVFFGYIKSINLSVKIILTWIGDVVQGTFRDN